MREKKRLFYCLALSAVALLTFLPLFVISVPSSDSSDLDSRVVLMINNHTSVSLSNIVLKFQKSSAKRIVTIKEVAPLESVFLSPFLVAGEFHVTAHMDSVEVDCAEYWTGWPKGFIIDVYGDGRFSKIECVNTQWADRYSLFDVLRGRRPNIDLLK